MALELSSGRGDGAHELKILGVDDVDQMCLAAIGLGGTALDVEVSLLGIEMLRSHMPVCRSNTSTVPLFSAHMNRRLPLISGAKNSKSPTN